MQRTAGRVRAASVKKQPAAKQSVKKGKRNKAPLAKVELYDPDTGSRLASSRVRKRREASFKNMWKYVRKNELRKDSSQDEVIKRFRHLAAEYRYLPAEPNGRRIYCKVCKFAHRRGPEFGCLDDGVCERIVLTEKELLNQKVAKRDILQEVRDARHALANQTLTNGQNHTLNHLCLRRFCGECNGFHSRMEGHLEDLPWHQDSLGGRARRIFDADCGRAEHEQRLVRISRHEQRLVRISCESDVLVADVLEALAWMEYKGVALTEEEHALYDDALNPQGREALRLAMYMQEWQCAVNGFTAEADWRAWANARNHKQFVSSPSNVCASSKTCYNRCPNHAHAHLLKLQ